MNTIKLISIILAAFLIRPQEIIGEIKNGYETIIAEVIEELQFKIQLQNGNIHHLDSSAEWDLLNGAQKALVKAKIRELKKMLGYYQLTNSVINEFKTICPEIFDEVNNIKNYKNQEVDVYISVVPADHEIRYLSGATYISKDPDNEHICVSEYGKNTVSVKICAIRPALKVLAHELGHVKFIIPNLKRYIDYCETRYHQKCSNKITFNHQAADMGCKCVFEYEKIFKIAYKAHLKQYGETAFNVKIALKQMMNYTGDKENYYTILAQISEDKK
jgi:hypothetical protein